MRSHIVKSKPSILKVADIMKNSRAIFENLLDIVKVKQHKQKIEISRNKTILA